MSRRRERMLPGWGPLRRGFTLIELLIVLAIIGTVVAITFPSMVRSIQGNRLRTGVRAVVTVSRYARSMAILRNEEMALTFNLDKETYGLRKIAGIAGDESGGDVARVAVTEPGELKEESLPEEPEAMPTNNSMLFADGYAFGGAAEAGGALEGVNMTFVEMRDTGRRYTSGECTVVFLSNGRCEPFTVEVEDSEGKVVQIEVDALSSVTTREM